MEQSGSVLSNLVGVANEWVENAANFYESEAHARRAQKRTQNNMLLQNKLNTANAVGALANQVHGAKLAGLNPAMIGGAQPVVASVGLGQGAKAENVELDPAARLTFSQAANLDAQTEKLEAETAKIKGVDTRNVEADTNLKTVQALLGDANKDKVEAEVQNIKNINDQFELEKAGTALFGQAIAQDWQKQPWYGKLTSGQKMIVDDIAKGEVDFSAYWTYHR